MRDAGSRAHNLPHPADRPRNEECPGFPAACVGPYHYTNLGVTDAGHVWTTVTLPPSTGRRPADKDRAADLAVQNPYFNPRPVERKAVRALIAAAWAGDPPEMFD